MPTYEYECKACGHRFETFQSMTEKPLRRCPKCKGRLERLIGAGAGVIFRGSGFYSTDYRSKSYRQAQAKDKSESGSSGGSSDSSSKPPAGDSGGASGKGE